MGDVPRIGLLSVNEVIERLEELHGKQVRVFGSLTLEFEDHSLWHIPKAERVDSVPYGSSLWVHLEPEVEALGEEKLRRYQGRHVVASGIVDAGDPGHMSLWPGSIRVSALTKP